MLYNIGEDDRSLFRMRRFLLYLVFLMTSVFLMSCLSPLGRNAGGTATTDVNTSVPDPDDGVSEENIYFSPHDNCTDISKISAGMTDTEVRSILPIDSYADGIGAGLYVNDRETGHVFNVKWDLSKYPLVVTSITDTGIDVDFIAPVDALDQLEKGMTFNEVVQILGRPLYMTSSGTITMLWRIGDRDTFVHLPFVNGEAMIYDGDESPKPFSF